MILNHKEAIGFLVDAAEAIGFNRYTILNLHAALADNLLPADAAGRPAHRRRNQAQSFTRWRSPSSSRKLRRDSCQGLLIEDPFEQARAWCSFPICSRSRRNKRGPGSLRTSRSSWPIWRRFEDVPRKLYTEAVLGVYGGTGSSSFGTRSSGPTSDLPAVMVRSGNRSVSPIRFGCAIGWHCARLLALSFADAWERSRLARRMGGRECRRVRPRAFREVVERELLSLHRQLRAISCHAV